MTRKVMLLLLLLPVAVALFSRSYFLPSSPASSSPLRSLFRGLLPHRTQHSASARNQTAAAKQHSAASATSNEEPPSAWPLMDNTAEAVAFMRYIAAKEQQLPVEEAAVLELLLPAHLTDLARTETGRREMKERMRPSTYETVLARTKHIDNTLSEAMEPSTAAHTSAIVSHRPQPRPIEQLVILGAGSDTRAIRLQEQLADNGVIVFEVDVADTQAAKQSKLLQAIAAGKHIREKGDVAAAYDNTRYVPLNLTQAASMHNHTKKSATAHETAELLPSLFSALHSAGYSDSKPTLFLLEGLVPYLPPETVNDTLHALHHHSPPASVLVMDYFAPSPDCEKDELDVVIEQVEAMGEPILFTIQTEVDRDADYPAAHKHELQALLSKNGWHLVELLEPDELTERYIQQPTQPQYSGERAAEAAGEAEEEVACFERIVTAVNKPVEVEIEIVEP